MYKKSLLWIHVDIKIGLAMWKFCLNFFGCFSNVVKITMFLALLKGLNEYLKYLRKLH